MKWSSFSVEIFSLWRPGGMHAQKMWRFAICETSQLSHSTSRAASLQCTMYHLIICRDDWRP
eukprot:scaffold276316_cov42-Prasinocladus_malaysianus.AAC.1